MATKKKIEKKEEPIEKVEETLPPARDLPTNPEFDPNLPESKQRWLR